jgi:hypothetical protein
LSVGPLCLYRTIYLAPFNKDENIQAAHVNFWGPLD